ncbi:MAG TPA: hypothetical protein VIQ31_34575 [Phormidium sp.]
MQGQRKSIREWSQAMIQAGITDATPNYLMGKTGKKLGDVISYEELQAALGNSSSQQQANPGQPSDSQQAAGTVGMVGEVAQELKQYADGVSKNLALQGKQEIRSKTAYYLSLPEETVRGSMEAAPTKGGTFNDFFTNGVQAQDLSQLLGQQQKLPQLTAVGTAPSTLSSLEPTLMEPSTQPQSERSASSEDTPTTESL